RQVMVVTRDETALSVLAFNVVAGHAAIHGTVVDADTGEPLAAAAIAVQGSTAGASTGTDGEFLVDPAPPGQLIVLVNAPDHELLSLPCEAVVGQVAELGEIAVRTTVYDPGRPASVSVHSLLGRAVNDLTGGLTFEQAREAIRDALILVGGTEAGVLDEYGNQLNPKVEGAGLSSLQDRGVQFYAEKIAAGETIGLLELLYQLSFGFSWSGGAPPKVNQWLAALQEIVDDAWASPNDPASAMPILLFNQGPRLNPNPPQISGSTRVNKFQAYLAVDSFLAAFAKSHPAGGLARAPLASKTADDDAPVYTTTWEDLLAAFGVAPTAPELPVSGGDVLPDLTMLIQQYYLDNSAEALAEVKEQLLELFPTLGLEQIFKENPYGVKEALDEVIRIAAEDISVHDVLQDFLTPDASHPDLTQLLQVNKGMCDMELYWGPEYFLKDLSINIVQSSWAPGAPYIWSVQETTTDLGGGIVIPAVEVVFYKSGDDYGDSASETYTYRLWRVDTDADSTLDRDADGTADRGTTSKLTLVGSGQVGDIEKMAPQVYRSDARKRVFKAFLPPAGMNRYRIDVVRLRGDGATLSAFDPSSAAYKNKLKPWLAGYVDDPAVIDPLGRIGRQQVHPGQGFLNATTSFTISPLSNAVSVWVGGQGSGLSRFGRVDLAADYKDKSKIYLSIPGWDENTEDRASGMIFRYDATNESLEKWTDPGFMLPGQIGLAIDENFNLYADNAASDTAYGGRIFRYVGYRRPDEDAFAPAYAAGTEKSKQHVGSVNYYSRDIQRAQPAMVQQVVVGPAANYGQDLFIADSDKNRITRLPVHLVEQVANVDTWHVTSQDWAWNSHTPPDGVPPIAFSWQSDLCFSRDLTKLFITQGSNVTWTSGGVDSGRAVTTGGAMFQNATGCAVCEAQGEQYLFVSDGLAGRIYRIPLAELPLDVPEDDAERKLFADRYAFIDSIDRPGQLRVTDDGGALVWADAVGLRYQRFGFSGQALDAQNNPLVGAVVTVDTASGPRSTTSDADGNYNFLDFPAQPFAYATITHPDYSTTERLALVGRCNANTRPVPCVLITSPGDGGPTGDGSVTVRGTIFPNAIDYAATASFLEVNDGSGTRTLPLVFTGHANDFVVEDVPLAIGDTVLYARVPAAGTMDAGSSIGTHVRRVSGVPETQAVAGVVLDERGDPRADVTVAISVNGVEVARAVSNACGYYNKDGLPPGAVTVEVLDGTEGRR
nr:carboxypeptidase regulatory-like domain-containing protein [Acidobacteriota bacterium]